MKTQVVVTVALALIAGLQWASARTYTPATVPVPLPFDSLWPKVSESSLSSPHIVGGTEAEPHSHPHHVALIIMNENETEEPVKAKVASCGGSLISDSWVVTAAHCLDHRIFLPDDPDDNSANLDKIKGIVIVGAHNYTNEQEPGSQRVSFSNSNLRIHPEWNVRKNALGNDIALIKLDNPVVLDGQAKAIRLPKLSQKEESFYDYAVTMTGWGITGWDGKPPAVLQQLNSKVVGSFYCKFRYLFLLVRDTNICASGWGWKGICFGDSGGPMIVKEADKEPTLVGLTSFSMGCSWGFPLVYTRITSYLDWIHSTTGIPQRI